MSTTKAPPYPIRSSGPKPLHFRGLTLGRLDHFENGPYANINAVLEEHRTDSAEFVQISSWSSPGRDKVSERLRGAGPPL
jgi:alpha-mannosidase